MGAVSGGGVGGGGGAQEKKIGLQVEAFRFVFVVRDMGKVMYGVGVGLMI